MAEERFRIRVARGGGYYWDLQAANNEIVCLSQVYTSKEACTDGAFWVKKNAAGAAVWDYTDESS